MGCDNHAEADGVFSLGYDDRRASKVRVHWFVFFQASQMSVDPDFQYDDFLSHSSRDNDVIRDIANRRKSDEVRFWFDGCEIQPGDSIPAKFEEGSEHSRMVVLCLSQPALAADWPQLESHAFRFKDLLSHKRRFIPFRLDDAPTNESLAQFSCIDGRRAMGRGN